MTDFFSSIAEDVVRGSLTEMVNQADLERLWQIQKNWDFYRGDQVHYLLQEDEAFLAQRPQTTAEEREQVRRKIRTHFNYTRLIVQRYLNGVYGLEVRRELKGPPENDAIMVDVWKQNRIQSCMQSIQRIAELESLCVVIPRWKERERRIIYERYGAQHVIPIPCPDNPTELYALILSWTAENKWGLVPDIIEDTLPGTRNFWRYVWNTVRSSNGNRGLQKYAEIWTPDRVQAYLGKELLINEENPYGELPFAVFRAEEDDASWWGQTNINDVVAINHVINRLLSDLIEIVRVHGFSLLFVSGEMVDEMVLKPTSFLKVNQGADGSRADARYLTPNSPIREIQFFLNWLIERLADTAQVPQATITGGDRPESGFALTIRWLPYTQMLAQKRNNYKEKEEDLIRKTLLVARTHLQSGDPDALEGVSIEFIDDNFVPRQEDEARARDAFLLANDVITPLDLLRDKQPDLDEEQLMERFFSNVRFNRQIRDLAATAGQDMDSFMAALKSESLRARVREKATEALLQEQLSEADKEVML